MSLENNKSEKMLNRFLNMSYNLFCIVDMTNGHFKYINSAWKTILGYSEDDLIGKPYHQFLVQKDKESSENEVEKLSNDIPTVDFENNYIHKNGSVHTILWTAQPFTPEGLIYCVGQDITQRKQSEIELQRSRDEMESRVKQRTIELTDNKEKLYHLLQNIQAAVVVHGSDTKIKDCNKKSQELLGLTRDQMLGKTTTAPSWKLYNENGDVLLQENYPVNQVINSTIEIKNLIIGIYRPAKDDLIKVLVNAIPSFDSEGNMADIIVTFMDITKRMQTEEALQESDKKLKELNEELENKIKKRTASLEDVNTALKVLLKKREEDKNQIGENIYANFTSLVQPFLNQLKKSHSKNTQKDILDILESSIKEMITPFSKKLSDPIISLTPTEIQVASLVKAGNTNKEVAQILNKSVRAVSSHRNNIRLKLGLKNKKINLRTYLLSLN
ncbi:MAG: PAS domain S-box protein [archaeon]|nr:PAS domain S-box protein [archaeon]